MGFTQPASHLAAGELLPHHFALTRLMGILRETLHLEVAGRYVSVALSLRSPSLDVIQHPALWSSDFPRALQPAIACFAQTHAIKLNTQVYTRPASELTLRMKTRYNVVNYATFHNPEQG
jgi:hypothetical protein